MEDRLRIKLWFLISVLVLSLLASPALAAQVKPAAALAIALSDNRFILTWTDNANNEKLFYVLERVGPASAAWIVLGTTDENVNTFEGMLPALPNAKVCWRVVAANDAGDANPTNTVCVKVPK